MKKSILAFGIIALFIGMGFIPAGASSQFNPVETLQTKTTNDPGILNITYEFKGIINGYRAEGEYTVIKSIYVVRSPAYPEEPKGDRTYTRGTEIFIKGTLNLCFPGNFLEKLGIDTSNIITFFFTITDEYYVA